MSDSFHLHNRGQGSDSSVSTSKLEAYAVDRKEQLGNIVSQLKKMVTHLTLITDEEVKDEDVLEE